MDDIQKLLQDNTWWFTVFVGGSIAAIISGLVVNRLERWIASGSTWYRARALARSQDREALIAALVGNQQYLQLAYAHVAIGYILVVFFLVVAVGLHSLLSDLPTIDEAHQGSLTQVKLFFRGFATGAGISIAIVAIFVLNFAVSRRFSVVAEAMNRWVKQKRLPPFRP